MRARPRGGSADAGRHLLRDHDVRGRDVVRPGDSRDGAARRRTRTSTRCSTSYVPGFDGVRVPARFGMIVTLGLAALAALGIAAIDRRRRTTVRGDRRRADPRRSVRGADSDQPELHGVCAARARAAAGVDRDRRRRAGGLSLRRNSCRRRRCSSSCRSASRRSTSATCSTRRLHWRRLVNGYSGGAPASYGLLTESLKDIATRPDRAWQAIDELRSDARDRPRSVVRERRRRAPQRVAAIPRRARTRRVRLGSRLRTSSNR